MCPGGKCREEKPLYLNVWHFMWWHRVIASPLDEVVQLGSQTSFSVAFCKECVNEDMTVWTTKQPLFRRKLGRICRLVQCTNSRGMCDKVSFFSNLYVDINRRNSLFGFLVSCCQRPTGKRKESKSM